MFQRKKDFRPLRFQEGFHFRVQNHILNEAIETKKKIMNCRHLHNIAEKFQNIRDNTREDWKKVFTANITNTTKEFNKIVALERSKLIKIIHSSIKENTKYFKERFTLKNNNTAWIWAKRKRQKSKPLNLLKNHDGYITGKEYLTHISNHYLQKYREAENTPNNSTWQTPFPHANITDLTNEKLIYPISHKEGEEEYKNKANPNPGPFLVYPKLLKKADKPIHNIILNNINTSLAENELPKDLKIGIIKPIFKKGDPEKLGNYRPICVQPLLTRITHNIFAKRLMDLLIMKNTINEDQHGPNRNRKSSAKDPKSSSSRISTCYERKRKTT